MLANHDVCDVLLHQVEKHTIDSSGSMRVVVYCRLGPIQVHEVQEHKHVSQMPPSQVIQGRAADEDPEAEMAPTLGRVRAHCFSSWRLFLRRLEVENGVAWYHEIFASS